MHPSMQGNLVISKSTGKSVAIVEIPIHGKNRKVAGVLGASVYLDQMSERLGAEMGLRASGGVELGSQA